MKSLDQLESRTPISSVPYTISTSGSYYLTSNVEITNGGDAIVIAVGNVSLDLNGYTIISTSGSSPSGTAILLSGPVAIENVNVRNGQIQGGTTYAFGSTATGGGFTQGICAADGQELGGVRVESVSVSRVAGFGINLRKTAASSSLAVKSCTVRICGGTGIIAEIVADSSATRCRDGGIVGQVISNSLGDSEYNPAVDGMIDGQSRGVVNNCIGNSVNHVGIRAAVVNQSRGVSLGGEAGISASEIVTASTGTAPFGSGIVATVVASSTGRSTSGAGVQVLANAINSYGISTSGNGMIVSNNAENCSGRTTSGTYAMNVEANAANCSGVNTNGSAATRAMSVGRTAQGCFGQHGNGGLAVAGQLLIGCTGTSSGTPFLFNNKYNMP